MIVFESGNEGDFYVFSSKGQLINRINRKGEGPEEYTTSQDFWVRGDSLAIYTRGKYIKWYDFDENFLEVKDVVVDAGHLLPYKNGYAAYVSFTFLQDSLRYSFAFTDKNFGVEKIHQKAGPMPNMRIFIATNSLQAYKDLVLYQKITCDTLYFFDGNSFKPFIHFDLGEEWAFAEGEEFSDEVFSKAISSGKAWNVVSKVSEQLVLMKTFGGEAGKNRYLIDRVSGKKVRIDVSVSNTGEYFNMLFSHWQENHLYGRLNSLNVSQLLDQLKESQYSYTTGTTLDEIESSENPALVKIKFKDSSVW